MTLTQIQIKIIIFIQRGEGEKYSPSMIATDLKIPVKQVNAEIQKIIKAYGFKYFKYISHIVTIKGRQRLPEDMYFFHVMHNTQLNLKTKPTRKVTMQQYFYNYDAIGKKTFSIQANNMQIAKEMIRKKLGVNRLPKGFNIWLKK